MPRQATATKEATELNDDPALFPELNDTKEHKLILEQARLLKAKKVAASKAKDKRDEVEEHLMVMMEEAGLPGFRYDGVIVTLKTKKHATVKTARKDDPKVDDAEENDSEDD
jgi:hypothetical protein